MSNLYFESENELYHHGIKGQKWGVRRFQNRNGSYTSAGKKRRMSYRSTSLASLKAKHDNKKIDKSFKEWNENKVKKEKALESGKARNQALMDYRMNPKDKNLKRTYKENNKQYKHDLRQNTAYRKGVVRGEIKKDEARKHLSQAKKIERQLRDDPNNRDLKRQYRYHMNQHDVARAKGRKAPIVGANRSRRIANLRSMRTRAVKGALVAESAVLGAYSINRYLNKHGGGFQITPEQVRKWSQYGKRIMDMNKYFF